MEKLRTSTSTSIFEVLHEAPFREKTGVLHAVFCKVDNCTLEAGPSKQVPRDQ